MYNRIQNKVKNKWIDFGFYKLQKFKGSGIIYYHGIDKDESTKYNYRFVGLKQLEEQLLGFKKYFNIISVEDFFAGKVSADRFNLVITFDDGYQNNFKYAVPLLEKHKIKATIFVTALNDTPYNILWADALDIFSQHFQHETVEFDGVKFRKNRNGRFTDLGNYIKSDSRGEYVLKGKLHEFIFSTIQDFRKSKDLDDYWKLVSDEELKQVSTSEFVKIGSHGYWHNNLGNISLDNARQELTASRKYLENVMQYEVNSIAYPDGSYTSDVLKAAYEIGFTRQLLCVASQPEHAALPYVAERDEIGPYGSANQKIYQIVKKFSK